MNRSGDNAFADVGFGYGATLGEVGNLDVFASVAAIALGRDIEEVCRLHGYALIDRQVDTLGDGDVQASLATALEVLGMSLRSP